MTTIACNLREMAGDSKVSGGSYYHTDKIFKIGGALVGVAGDVQNTTKFLAWFRKECPPDESGLDLTDGKGFEALVLKDGVIYYYADCVEPDRLHEKFFAIGTGAGAALAAMHLGKSPHEAVKLAAKIDHNTGGAVKVLELEPRKRKSKKARPEQRQPEIKSGEADA